MTPIRVIAFLKAACCLSLTVLATFSSVAVFAEVVFAEVVFAEVVFAEVVFAEDDKKSVEAKPADENQADDNQADDNQADDNQADAANPADVLEGHSYHGDAFNEGPRQKAYLMAGTGPIQFNVTSTIPDVQKFVEQGIGQLHGFWYFEAERSFRQAAKLDPDCAIAYWGMALANENNYKRGKGFIAKAVERKGKASEREQKYIEALSAYLSNSDHKKQVPGLIEAYEKIAKKFPHDLEAKALRAYLLYQYRSTVKRKYSDIDNAINEVLAVEPMHPAHHYRIHLWDRKNAAKALDSAALCGQSAAAIAHMWHMPGHVYARLERHYDAAWQQEAAARVDHAQMMRDRVMPDQIHNFAHNNEWMIRSLAYIGRHQDAARMAKNMIEMPRHPKYNTLKRHGTAYYGRLRLFGVLSQFELWDELIAACEGAFLVPTDSEVDQIKRLHHLGVAYTQTGNRQKRDEILKQLEDRLQVILAAEKKAEKKEAEKKEKAKREAEEKAATIKENTIKENTIKENTAKENTAKENTAKENTAKEDAAKKKNDKKTDKKEKKKKAEINRAKLSTQRAIAAIKGYALLAEGKHAESIKKLRTAKVNALDLAKVQWLAGEKDVALKAAENYMKKRKKRCVPLAKYAELLWLADKKEDAEKTLKTLRKYSGSIQLGSPVFDRITPIAQSLGLPEDWRLAHTRASDVGVRPSLDALGPYRWLPMPAAEWTLPDATGKMHSLKDYQGKPVMVIFYLGYACLHCAEQIQAFAPMAEEFEKAGISLIAVSTDNVEGLKKSLESYEGKIPFPLVSDTKLDIFRQYRAYDDFENMTLHGTFLIDEKGLVRWQDIGYEPFMDPKFALTEAKRLLAIKTPAGSVPPRYIPPPIPPRPIQIAKKPSVAKSQEIKTHLKALRTIDPRGIAGSLVLSGVHTPDAALAMFYQLAQGPKSRVVVLRCDASEKSIAETQRLLAQWDVAAGGSIEVIRVGAIDKSTAVERLKKATGLWIIGDNSERIRKRLAEAGLVKACRAVVNRGGVLGGSAGFSRLASSRRFTDETTATTSEEALAALPGSLVDVVSESNDNTSRIDDALKEHAKLLGFEIMPNAALIVRGRRLFVVGDGRIRVSLAAIGSFAVYSMVLDKKHPAADFTALRRFALERGGPKFPAETPASPHVEKGTLMIVGGGSIPSGLSKRFVVLAGGKNASIIILPTAVPGRSSGTDSIAEAFRRAGAKEVTILAGRTPAEVDSKAYLDAMGKATGVWFGGGRQWRFVDAYLGSAFHERMFGVLQRGGVIAGSSAGASIQGEYMARGTPIGNAEIMADGYERGLGFLAGVAIDQHFKQRNRFNDMSRLVSRYPQILGIGIDETTAIVVQGQTAEVIGRGRTHFFDMTKQRKAGDHGYESIAAGGRYDLKNRKLIPPAQQAIEPKPPEPADKSTTAAVK